MTNIELINSLLDDLNNMLKSSMNGQQLQACAILTGITQKLINLRSGVESEIKNRDEIIEKLKKELCRRGVEVAEIGGVNE